jgi:hypothetical protein
MERFSMVQDLSLRHSRSNNRRPQVEELEHRWCPAGGKGSPVLTYTVVQMNDPGVVITGQVSGTYNAYSTVQFTGAVVNSITTNATGNFSFTVNAQYLGTVTGIGWDNRGVQTNALMRSVNSLDPTFMSFTAYQGSNNMWTFSGHVNNEALAGNKVTFQGFSQFEGAYVYTDANGDFSYDVTLDAGAWGTVVATVADCWDLTDSTCITI